MTSIATAAGVQTMRDWAPPMEIIALVFAGLAIVVAVAGAVLSNRRSTEALEISEARGRVRGLVSGAGRRAAPNRLRSVAGTCR